jgi:hypothetical protein
MFSDEAVFHILGTVNRYRCRVWGSKVPNEHLEHEPDCPNVNVWCAVMKDKVTGPFFFLTLP